MLFLSFALLTGVCSCDLYKPQQDQKSAESSAQQVHKLPLPQRGAQSPAGQPPASPAVNKESGPAAGESAKPVQAAAPVATPVTKTIPVSTEATKKVDVVSPGEKKALPAHVDAKDQKTAAMVKDESKSSQQVKKTQPPVAGKKVTPASEATKTAVVASKPVQKEKPAVPSVKQNTQLSSARSWVVVAGPYLLEEVLAHDLAKVRKAGVSATVQQSGRRKTPMHRLFLAQFRDRAAAQGELDKLKKITSDAFVLDHGGQHVVYAGSYLLNSRAASEKERLATAGFAVTVKLIDVSIPSKKLFVGTYRDKDAAEAAANKLKKAGLKNVQVHQ
jgi:hypothetical protein